MFGRALTIFITSVVVVLLVSAVNAGPVLQRTKKTNNNVCRSFPDYNNLLKSKNCFYNPDQESTPTELAERYGFALDHFKVTTDDGYILTIFRLSKKNSTDKDRPPLILQHGILVDGVSWIISGEKSLGFRLVNAGYDVWLPNWRGTQFSYGHVNAAISEKEYWNFSFHEMAIHDLPKFVEFFSNTTNKKNIAYIGHSMGSTAALIYSSIMKEHARRYIGGMVLLAPVAYARNIRGLTRFMMPMFGFIKNLLESLDIYAIGQFNDFQKIILKQTCAKSPLILPCQILEALTTGLVVDQIRPELFPIFFLDFPNGCALKTFNHFVQIFLRGGRFQQYDYGGKNMVMYNATVPPEYDVGSIKIPTYLFYGEEDFFVARKDAEYLYEKLNCPKGINNYNIAHNDFVYGKKIDKMYDDIVDVMRTKFKLK